MKSRILDFMSNPVFFSPYMSNPVFFYTQGSGRHQSEDEVSEFLTDIFSDLSIDREENAELVAFFVEVNPPPVDKLIFTPFALDATFWEMIMTSIYSSWVRLMLWFMPLR